MPAAFEIRKTVTRNALAGQRDSTKRALDLARPRPGNPRIPSIEREGGGDDTIPVNREDASLAGREAVLPTVTKKRGKSEGEDDSRSRV